MKKKICKLIVFVILVFVVFLLGMIIFNVFLKKDEKFLYSDIKQVDTSDIGEYEQIL